MISAMPQSDLGADGQAPHRAGLPQYREHPSYAGEVRGDGGDNVLETYVARARHLAE